MGAGRVQSSLLVAGIVVFVGLVVGGVLLVRVEPEGGDSSCGPATEKEAAAVSDDLAERYWKDADPTEAPVVQGMGVGEDDNGDSVVQAMLLPGTDSGDYPRCVDDVPVQWMFAGPFQAD